MRLSGTEVAAMTDADAGPLVRGRAGWLLAGKTRGYATNTIIALERKGLLTLSGPRPGIVTIATINRDAWRKVLLP